MELKTFYAPGVSHFSYMILAAGQAVVIDPQRDIEAYLQTSAEWQAPITRILVTHNHADFAGGQRRLHQATGATIVMGERAAVNHPFEAVKEGDRILVGPVELEVVETPGHTPEHVSYLLVDHDVSDAPLAMFSGDSLFSGDVGRPDLFGPDAQQALTRQLFETLAKYRGLPDGVLVYPAHGAGSLCGKRVGQRNPSSIGYEKRVNSLLKLEDYDGFRTELFSAMPTPPRYYFATAKKNATGEGMDRLFSAPQPLTPRQVESWEGVLLDLRDQAGFAAGHIPGSLNAAMDIHFSLLVGFTVDPGARIALVGSPDEVRSASLTLYRMGYDHTEGFLAGGIDAWRKQALPTGSFDYLGAESAHALVKSQKAVLLDVRTESERAEERIPGARHIPLARLDKRLDELPHDRRIIVQCGHGCRGSLTVSILRNRGFTQVANLAGGILAWKAAELPVETGGLDTLPHAA
jgi:hydroxyacylglutathione hydrolase